MSLITDKPEDLKSSNALDAIEIPDETVQPAYLSFGSSPCPIVDPPEIDEVRTYLVRVRCVGSTVTERTDGEMRHGRKLKVQLCWQEGKPKPPDPEEQPSLFDQGGEPDK